MNLVWIRSVRHNLRLRKFRVNNLYGTQITNLIFRFIYAALFIIIENISRTRGHRRLLVEQPCNYACIKIYEEHQLEDRALSSTFIEDSSHPNRGWNITHRTLKCIGGIRFNDFELSKAHRERSCNTHLFIAGKNLYFTRYFTLCEYAGVLFAASGILI